MFLKLFLLIALFYINLAHSANILALFPIPCRSHFAIYQPLLEKLAERGHQIDVLTHFPRNIPLNGYTDYSIRREDEFYSFDIDIEMVKSLSLLDILNIINFNAGATICYNAQNKTATQNLMKSKKEYDLIITEIFFSDCSLGFATMFNVPIIVMTSSVSMPWASDIAGLPDNPSYIPHYFSPYSQDMTFLEKLMNTVTLQLIKMWHTYYPSEEANKFIQETFGRNSPHIEDIRKNISLVMVNSHFSLQQSRPLPPNFIEIGGIHLKPNPVLPKEFENHLKTNLKGVVYLSFGTTFKSETFPDYKLKPIFEALSEIPYKILWKGKRSDVAKHLNIPSNIQFVPWMPQLEVLCHPNLKLFISHCGLGGVQEAIYCGKPVLGLPIWADQFAQAKIINDKGLGLTIPLLKHFTKENLLNVLQQLLENPRFTENARRSSEIFRDRQVSPLDTAVYWAEYVIRHKGAPHLKSKAAYLTFYEYYCLDIAFTLCFTTLILGWIFYKISKRILNLIVAFRVFKRKLE
nr:UDP-glucuronosyltransferase 2A3-like [Onthophagus taurus]